MIEILSPKLLSSKPYTSIMDEFERMWSVLSKHKYEISAVGTQSRFYPLSIALLLHISHIPGLNRISRNLVERIYNYLNTNKIPLSREGVTWTGEIVLRSSRPWAARHVEYPWAIMNSKLDRPMKILDVGSGISLFPIYLALKGHEVFSIDADEILMKRTSPKLAKWLNTKVNYNLGDVLKIDYDDCTFDRVFCISVLEHLEEERVGGKYINKHTLNLDVKAIAEMLRVLKPNGFLILTFDWSESPNEERSYKLLDIYNRVLKLFHSYLLVDKIPDVNWNEIRESVLRAWKSFPPYDYVVDTWAVGAILQKSN